MPYGLSGDEWKEAKEEIRQVLSETARMERTITYSDLAKEVHAVHLEPNSHVLAYMLDEISIEEDMADRGMLSVVVVHKLGDLKPGPRYFQLAKKLGRQTTDKQQCWINELQRVYASWVCVGK